MGSRQIFMAAAVIAAFGIAMVVTPVLAQNMTAGNATGGNGTGAIMDPNTKMSDCRWEHNRCYRIPLTP